MISLQELYPQVEEQIRNHSASCLNVQREYYAQQLTHRGLPTRRTENYRHIDLSEPLAIDYGVNVNQLHLPTTERPLHCNVHGMNSLICWVVNNTIDVPHDLANQGVVITTLRQATIGQQQIIGEHINKIAQKYNDSLLALNEMFAQDGLFIYVPDNVHVDRPIQIMTIASAPFDLFVPMHHLVVIGENAHAQVLVCDHAVTQNNYLSSATTEVFVGNNAVYEHYNLEDSSDKMCKIQHLLIEQQKSSDVKVNIITLRNGISRNNVLINQIDSHCKTDLSGMFIGGGKQVTDNFTQVNHLSTHSHSNELFKYVLDDNSRGVFKGNLKVVVDAQKTEAYQTNRNILLSRTAKVRTEPQLEIYADDVKCSHGATTGQLDDTALFYMQQRGIPYDEARLLLMNAFVADVVDRINIEALRDRVRTLTDSRLRSSEQTPCNACNSYNTK